jgi:hypothetical protein
MSIKPVDEIVYFPCKNMGHVEEKSQDCSEQLETYKGLLEVVEPVKQFVKGYSAKCWQEEKENLAFLIEATKQLDPDNWKDTIKYLKMKILDLSQNNASEAPKEVTWILLQTINTAYKASLAFRSADAHNNGNGRQGLSFERTLQLYDLSESLASNMHQEGKPVCFNVIRPEFVPLWYKRNNCST